MGITSLRQEINEIDDQVLSMLNKRANIALKIGQLKRETQLPVFHEDREKQILERLCAANRGPLEDDHILKIFTGIIKACRELQNEQKKSDDI